MHSESYAKTCVLVEAEEAGLCLAGRARRRMGGMGPLKALSDCEAEDVSGDRAERRSRERRGRRKEQWQL